MYNEKLHMDFMLVMCEMSVIFYDHHISRKLVSFESYCSKVCKLFECPEGVRGGYYTTSHEKLMMFLTMELETQYGIVGESATEIILDFYTNRYWVGIYKSQTKVNKSLFPSGYHKKLKGL